MLQADADRYTVLALELGATEARVIPASKVPLDERVTLKCSIPKCFGYGTCANCPPYAPTVEQMQRIVARYELAVVLSLDEPAAVLVRDRETIAERVAAYKQVFSLISAIESAAFYDGHYLSVGLAAGSCKSTYCHDLGCSVLEKSKCRHNLVARPSMEAVGIDCFALGTELGWEMYPIGSSATADAVPASRLMGLVLIG